MKTTPRFETAIQKLYTAFHADRLNPECCKECAVGTMLDHTDSWKHLSDAHGSLKLNYVGLVNQKFGKRFNGYTPMELLQIEATFLKACGFQLPLHHKNSKPTYCDKKDMLFAGLSAVITFLCELDGIQNIMEFKNLFSSKKKHFIYNEFFL